MNMFRPTGTGKPGAAPRQDSRRGSGWQWRWIAAWSFTSGFFALLWLILRSGTRPSRFAYPCQQAALSTAWLAFGVPLASALVTARRRIASGLRSPAGLTLAVLGLLITAGVWGYVSRAQIDTGSSGDPLPAYRASVYRVTHCPEEPDGDRFPGLDRLFNFMGGKGLKFYESEDATKVSGPDGIIAADDVVIIKINYQWGERGGSNTDVLRGLIRWVVDHPEGFTGEIVVCENTQFASSANFDRSSNNARDHHQSPRDVVLDYQDDGHTVSLFDWTAIRYTAVDEYDQGDSTDGYVVYDYDAQVHGRISYPKFRTDAGTYISLKYGTWNPVTENYRRGRLKFINLPVLKSHHATYGATACVKNYMGVVTDELSTYSHSGIYYGLLGALMGEIQPADLNILDCIWINANPYYGPWTGYADATRRDQLVASTDPVAADIWAVKNILIPAFIENGYAPPWPNPSADPDDPSSAFRNYLDNSMDYLLAAGYRTTNNLSKIDAFTRTCSDEPIEISPGNDLEDFEEGPQIRTRDFSGNH
jgi:hypothetical protein